MSDFPERIVCLSDETTETLYLLEEDWRIVGISAFTARPTRARAEKQIVSGFSNAQINAIIDLKPDLVLGFSDVQADIAKQLIAHGMEVHIFNHRTVDGILRMIRTVGALVGNADRANRLAQQLRADLAAKAKQLASPRPRVYFEEWNEPLITGIGWVSEIIELAGGDDIFAELAKNSLAKDRTISPAMVIERCPDIIVASWCGKPFRKSALEGRPGWSAIPAVANQQVYAIDSSVILQPGPAALTDGARQLRLIFDNWLDAPI